MTFSLNRNEHTYNIQTANAFCYKCFIFYFQCLNLFEKKATTSKTKDSFRDQKGHKNLSKPNGTKERDEKFSKILSH